MSAYCCIKLDLFINGDMLTCTGKEGKMVCTNSTKQLLVKTPPAVLILHLKRFQVHRTMFRKLTRHVSFPPVLDLAPICSAMYKVGCDVERVEP